MVWEAFERVESAARVATVASPGRAAASTPTASGAFGQRLGVVPSAPRGRTPFTVSAAQQEQPNGARVEPQQPAAVQPVVGTVPAARPGMPMGTTDPRQATVNVPTGAFGTVNGPTDAFGSTLVPETSGRSEITIPRP